MWTNYVKLCTGTFCDIYSNRCKPSGWIASQTAVNFTELFWVFFGILGKMFFKYFNEN